MDIHDRVSELEARISKLETHLQRLVSMADPSLQPVKRVVLELDATRGQETAMLELLKTWKWPPTCGCVVCRFGIFTTACSGFFPVTTPRVRCDRSSRRLKEPQFSRRLS